MRNNTMLPFLLLIFVFIFVIALTSIPSQSCITEIIPICFVPPPCSCKNCVTSVTCQCNEIILLLRSPSIVCNSISQIQNLLKSSVDAELKNVLKYPTYNTGSFSFFTKNSSTSTDNS